MWVAVLPSEGPRRVVALTELVKIDLRRHWQDGQPKSLESYLQTFPELGTPDTVAVDLILAEWSARGGSGTGPAALEEFARRFPNQAEALRRELAASAPPDPERRTDATGQQTQASDPPSGPVSAAVPPPELPARFRLVRELSPGEGNMGTVFLARDEQLGRLVALKRPRLQADGNEETLARFRREARAAATLSHRNLCRVYDVYEDNAGVPFLAMEFVEGRSLKELLRDGPLPPGRAAEIVRTLALAMEAAHNGKVLHRDLKPANVVLDKSGQPVIVDFGLALHTEDDARLTQVGRILGSPAYMPPEQFRGQPEAVGPAFDIYSLGAVLFELLTGRVPFQGPWGQMIADKLIEPPESPLKYRPDLDPRLGEICRKATARKPTDRYPSMADLAADLALFLGNSDRPTDPLPAPDPAPQAQTAVYPNPPRRRRWRRSEVVVAAGAVALGFLLVGQLLFALGFFGRSNSLVTVAIRSVPTGAKVFIDGKAQERRTDADFDLAEGEHELRLELDGHQPVTRQIYALAREDGEPPAFRYALTRLPPAFVPHVDVPEPRYAVHIQTTPSGAKITLAGEAKPQTTDAQFELKAGNYELKLELAGHEPLTKTIHVEPRGENHFAYTLATIPEAPRHARLAVSFDRLSLATARKLQLELRGQPQVAAVLPGGGADRMGLRRDDVVVRVNGVEVRLLPETTAAVKKLALGESVTFEVLRDGQRLTLTGRHESPFGVEGEVPLLRGVAEGDAVFQHYLGDTYRFGRGVAKDEAEAARWYQKAADQNYAPAAYALGFLYESGQGVAQDDAAAVRWYLKAADQEYAFAQFHLGHLWELGRGNLPKDDAQAAAWFRKAALQDFVPAQDQLVRLFLAERGGLKRESAEAARWYREAADRGHTAAQTQLGKMYMQGLGVGQDDAEAVRWFRKAAARGDTAAEDELVGLYLAERGGLKRESAEAVPLFRKAADRGHAASQNTLALLYQKGAGGLSKNDTQAARWFRKAADQGHAAAQSGLGFLYAQGRGGLSKDDKQAAVWFRKAGEQGIAAAQNSLGFFYAQGRGGLEKDDAQAVQWYRKAAEQGYAAAQNNLGVMHRNGRGGLTKDDAQAVQWYRKAAEQGNAAGQSNLASMYEHGRSVAQDREEAIRWYRQAAAQGNPGARAALKRLGVDEQ
jgi:TPR repeat protein